MADMTWDYQSGKHVLDTDNLPDFQIDPHFIQLDPSLGSKWVLMADDDNLKTVIWRHWLPNQSQPPKLLHGPMASGSAVLANASVTSNILRQQRKTLAVEMEAYGVYFAAEMAARPKPLVCAIKAVCDFADDKKDDGHQEYAAYTSASFVRAFFERYMADLAN